MYDLLRTVLFVLHLVSSKYYSVLLLLSSQANKLANQNRGHLYIKILKIQNQKPQNYSARHLDLHKLTSENTISVQWPILRLTGYNTTEIFVNYALNYLISPCTVNFGFEFLDGLMKATMATELRLYRGQIFAPLSPINAPLVLLHPGQEVLNVLESDFVELRSYALRRLL